MPHRQKVLGHHSAHHTGQLIQSWVQDNGLIGEEMSQKLGISRALLYQLYNRAEWPVEYLRRAATVMRTDVAWLAGEATYGSGDEDVRELLREIDAAEIEFSRLWRLLRERVRKIDERRQSKSEGKGEGKAPARSGAKK